MSLVQALIDEDEAHLIAVLAPRLARSVPVHAGAPSPPGTERGVYVRQLTAAVRSARLPPGTLASDLIEPMSMEVQSASDAFAPGTLPAELTPSDLVVRFRIAPRGRRALAALGAGGVAQLVVRPGPSPVVIAR